MADAWGGAWGASWGASWGAAVAGGMVPARRGVKKPRRRYQTPDGREFATAQEAADALVEYLSREQAKLQAKPEKPKRRKRRAKAEEPTGPSALMAELQYDIPALRMAVRESPVDTEIIALALAKLAIMEEEQITILLLLAI